MALIKQTVTGQIEVGELGTIGLRTDTVVLSPNDDVTGEDAKVQAVANAVWTTEVVAAYVAAQAAAEPAEEAPAE